jgi:hypothetical protein
MNICGLNPGLLFVEVSGCFHFDYNCTRAFLYLTTLSLFCRLYSSEWKVDFV